MSRVNALAARAERRALTRRAVRTAGPWLALGAGVALIATLTDRLIGPGLPWWAILPAAVVLPLLIAGALAFRARDSRLAALAEVDNALRLEDRLGSAMSLADRADSDPFAALAVREGERAAQDARVDRAITVRFGNSWVAWGVLLLLAAGVTLFVEPMHLLRNEAQHLASIEQAAMQTRAQEELDEVGHAIEQLSTEADPALADAPGAAEALAELERLREELERGETDADSARSDAAQSINDLADGLEEAATEAQEAHDAVREMFSRLPPKDAPTDAAERLAEALRSGDLDTAIEALDELQRQADDLPAEERAQAAQDLRALADDLEALAEAQRQDAEAPTGDDADAADNNDPASTPPTTPNTPTPTPPTAPTDQSGLTPEQRDELKQMGDAEKIEQELREQGFDEEPARKLAEQLEREARQDQARDEAAKRTQGLSDAARDAAEQLSKPPSPEQQPPQPGQPGQQPGEQPQPRDGAPPQQGDNNPPNENAPKQPGDAPSPPGAPSPTPAPQQQSQDGKPKPGEQGQPQQGQQPGQQQPQQQPHQQPGQQPGEQPGQQPGQQPGEQPGQQPGQQPGEQPGQQPGQLPGQQPGTQPGQQPGQQPGAGGQQGQPGSSGDQPQGAGDSEGPPQTRGSAGDSTDGNESTQGIGQGGQQGGSGVERLRQQIEDLRQQAGRAREQQQRADELRKRAGELLDGMSDDERQRMLDWADQLAREQGTGDASDFASMNRPPIDSETTPLDIRRPGDGGQVAGEFNDPNSRIGQGDISSRAPTAAEIREALEGLDQLVEDRAVPKSRQRVIERYFRKALERAERERSAAPPPPPAPDAGPVETAPDAGG